MSPKKQRNGVSLRNIQIFLVVGALLLSGLMLFSTHRLNRSFQQMTATSEQHIELRKAAQELMDASDYLTEKVQRFTVSGEYRFLLDYCNEAFAMHHREDAVDKMAAVDESKSALAKLQEAFTASNGLMKKEYYAMRLLIEANDYSNIPLALQSVTLSKEDKALSAEDKITRAREIVFGNAYYAAKNQIHESMQASLDELEKLVSDRDEAALTATKERMYLVRTVIFLQTAGIFFLVWLASHLGIHPILNAVDRIKSDSKIPESGTSEFRYLVRAYNKMYESYQKSLERLNFKASHDELTGVYNRAGYDALLENLDLSSTYMLLFDVDNFKSINDTYGHETGDKVLIKLVQTIKRYFRPDDFICRIGGDEFVVLMQHSPEKQEKLIAAKIESINRELQETADGLPKTSISVGIVHGSEADHIEDLFKKTDAVMYQAKQNGKSTFSFFAKE